MSTMRMPHPHIVGVHDRGEEDGQLWISTDFVDGLDAARLLAERYPAGMPVEEVARIVTAVASALDYAHRQGLLHRDVKPANGARICCGRTADGGGSDSLNMQVADVRRTSWPVSRILFPAAAA